MRVRLAVAAALGWAALIFWASHQPNPFPMLPGELLSHDKLIHAGVYGVLGFLVRGALAGRGLAWRSLWEVGTDLQRGALVSVLDGFAAPPTGIHAVFPQRKYLPLRVRLLIDHLKHTYGNEAYWGGVH